MEITPRTSAPKTIGCDGLGGSILTKDISREGNSEPATVDLDRP